MREHILLVKHAKRPVSAFRDFSKFKNTIFSLDEVNL